MTEQEHNARFRFSEVVADISYIAGCAKYYSGDSRADIRNFFEWAEEFERLNKDTDWDNDPDRDYMAEVEAFAERKLKEVPGDYNDETEYAKVVWTAEDVQTLAPSMTLEQAEEWLAENEGHIQDRLVETGWEVIASMLQGREP